MKMRDIKKIAKKNGIVAENTKKTELIRTIQRTEGNTDCFSTSHVNDCNQMTCLWREDCAQS